MPSGSDAPGRARADRLREEYEKNRRERDLANERLKVRAELKSITDEEPDTGVVHAEAVHRIAAAKSEPAPALVSAGTKILKAVQSPVQLGALAILAALLAFVAWLKWR